MPTRWIRVSGRLREKSSSRINKDLASAENIGARRSRCRFTGFRNDSCPRWSGSARRTAERISQPKGLGVVHVQSEKISSSRLFCWPVFFASLNRPRSCFFFLQDAKHTAAGDDIKQAAKRLWSLNPDQLVAVGVNCLHPSIVSPLITSIREANESGLPIPTIAYPNNGEHYDTSKKWYCRSCCDFSARIGLTFVSGFEIFQLGRTASELNPVKSGFEVVFFGMAETNM